MIYYLAIAAVGYVGYKKWEKEVNTIFIKSVFEMTKYYHELRDYFGYDDAVVIQVDNKESKRELIEINNGNFEIIDLPISENVFQEKIATKTLILNINDNHKILQNNNYDDIINLKKINVLKDKLFLQIIVENGENEIDILNKIKSFLVDGNMILSETFLKWFLNYHYNTELNDNYKVNIMDHNVNLITLEKDSQIKIGENKYIIINK